MGLTTFLRERPQTGPRGLQWVALSETAVIQSPVLTDDVGGGAAVAWQERGTAACRIYPVSVRGRGRMIGGAVSERSTHFLEMPAGVEIDLTDRVVIDTRGTFEVTVDLERTGALTTVVEVFRS